MSSNDPLKLTPQLGEALLELARRSIELGLATGSCSPTPELRHPDALTKDGASFVTVTVDRALRGCCGTLEGRRPLFEDVWCNAYASAFEDPRLPELEASERTSLGIEIAVLCPLESLGRLSESELLDALSPGRDGLVLELGEKRVTFLPKVWQTLPRREDFLRRLKQKAGWADDFWSREMRSYRYRTETCAWRARNE